MCGYYCLSEDILHIVHKHDLHSYQQLSENWSEKNITDWKIFAYLNFISFIRHTWSIPVSFFAKDYDPCFFMTRGRDRMVDGCYLWNQCLSVLTLWVRIPLRREVLDTTLCGKVCLWLAECRWFYPGTPVSSTNKTDRHDIIELLLKMTLNTITLFVTAFLLNLILQKIILHRIVSHNRKWPWNNTLYDSSWSVTNNIPVSLCDCKGTTCRLTIKIDYIFPGVGLELAYTTDYASY